MAWLLRHRPGGHVRPSEAPAGGTALRPVHEMTGECGPGRPAHPPPGQYGAARRRPNTLTASLSRSSPPGRPAAPTTPPAPKPSRPRPGHRCRAGPAQLPSSPPSRSARTGPARTRPADHPGHADPPCRPVMSLAVSAHAGETVLAPVGSAASPVRAWPGCGSAAQLRGDPWLCGRAGERGPGKRYRSRRPSPDSGCRQGMPGTILAVRCGLREENDGGDLG